MITKCANHSCGQPFKYFRGGKLFVVTAPSKDSTTIPGGHSRRLEHYWLCQNCASTMTLLLGMDGDAKVVSLDSGESYLLPKRMPARAAPALPKPMQGAIANDLASHLRGLGLEGIDG